MGPDICSPNKIQCLAFSWYLQCFAKASLARQASVCSGSTQKVEWFQSGSLGTEWNSVSQPEELWVPFCWRWKETVVCQNHRFCIWGTFDEKWTSPTANNIYAREWIEVPDICSHLTKWQMIVFESRMLIVVFHFKWFILKWNTDWIVWIWLGFRDHPHGDNLSLKMNFAEFLLLIFENYYVWSVYSYCHLQHVFFRSVDMRFWCLCFIEYIHLTFSLEKRLNQFPNSPDNLNTL